jgi:hypothetical protein
MLSQESKKSEWLSKKRQLQQRSSWGVFATPSKNKGRNKLLRP